MKYKRRSQFVSTVFSYIYIIVVFNVSFNVNKYPIINNIKNAATSSKSLNKNALLCIIFIEIER